MKNGMDFLKFYYEIFKTDLPRYATPKSGRRFTQPQLATILLFKFVTGMSYRDVEQFLARKSNYRAIIELRVVPTYSALFHAERRLQNHIKFGKVMEVWTKKLADAKKGGFEAALRKVLRDDE